MHNKSNFAIRPVIVMLSALYIVVFALLIIVAVEATPLKLAYTAPPQQSRAVLSLPDTPVPSVTPLPATPVRVSGLPVAREQRTEPANNPTLPPLPTFMPTPTAAPLPAQITVPAPTAPPSASGLVPTRLRIPSISVDAQVEQVGLDAQRRVDVPSNYANVAWFKLGAKPGERGNAIIDGHVDSPTAAAVFYNLKKLKVGDRIVVVGEKDQQKVFEVFETAAYPYNQAPLERIFGPSEAAQLILITCTGTFDRTTANYDQRFVVYTRLVE